MQYLVNIFLRKAVMTYFIAATLFVPTVFFNVVVRLRHREPFWASPTCCRRQIYAFLKLVALHVYSCSGVLQTS